MAYQVGQRIGDYEITGILGAGGMGKVYQVRNRISERTEAMKVLLPNLEGNAELADRFMREIRALASLQHPHIASLHSAQTIDNQIVMFMEFVEGVSLEAELRNGRIAVPKAIDYISQALSALAYAHSRGVIHRDIKPANMMVTPAGVVKLMDFGIAKRKEERQLTQTGSTVGSLYYMSPEQIQGSQALDARSDLYSVGVSLYELVTARRPFQGDSDYSIMAAHLGVTPVPPIEIDPSLPQMLNDVILMSIAKEPAQRFQSADAFRNALQNIRAVAAVAPPQPAAGWAATSVFMPPPPPAPAEPPRVSEPVTPPPVVRQGMGRRGLYMAVGSVVTLGVLAFAALQGPKWFRASEASTVPPSSPAAVESVPAPAQSSPAVVVEQPAAAAPAIAPEALRPSASPVDQRPASSREIVAQRTVPASRPAAAAQNPPAAAQQPAAPPPPAQAPPQMTPQVTQAPVPQTPVPPPARSVDAAKLTAVQKDLILLGSRANAIRASLGTLRRNQAAQGLNLRGDIAAAEGRMETFLDVAEATMKSGNASGAREGLESAEREIEKLEKFLGR